MQTYSDHILSLNPWSYCRLTEPVGVNVYSDSSGNRNHCFVQNQVIATNLTGGLFPGDPFPNSIRPLSSSQGTSLLISPNSINQNVPVIYNDHKSYYGGPHYEQKLIENMWGEVLIDFSGQSTYSVGPVKAIITNGQIVVGVFYNEWLPTMRIYTFKTCHTWSYSQTPHRVSIGVYGRSRNSFELCVTIDGTFLINREIHQLNTNDIFDLSDQNLYRQCGINGNCRISNLSLFFNKPYPPIEWISRSYSALTSSYNPNVSQDLSVLSSQAPQAQVLDSVPGSMLTLLDTVLFLGNNHYYVNGIESDGTLVKLFLMTKNQSHGFVVGDIISITGSGITNLDSHWKVEEVSFDFISVRTVQPVPSQNFSLFQVTVKRCPIGEGLWMKKYSNELVGYHSTVSGSIAKMMVIRDLESKTTEVTMTNRDFSTPSITLFIKKNLKVTETNFVRWKAGGDARRFFLFLAYRHDSPSQVNSIIFGDFRDFITEEWNCQLLAYKDQLVGNAGANVAMTYSDWIILPTGHLCCRLTTQQKGDQRWIRTTGSTFTYLEGYGDNGHHIYPDPVPYVEIL